MLFYNSLLLKPRLTSGFFIGCDIIGINKGVCMVNDALIKTVKCTLNADVTPMQKQILKGILIMMCNRLCYDIDITLSNMDKSLRGSI